MTAYGTGKPENPAKDRQEHRCTWALAHVQGIGVVRLARMAEAPPSLRSALPAEPVPGTEADGARPQGKRAASRRLQRSLSPWLPTMAVIACVGGVLGSYGVSVRDLAFFSGYVALGIALPGLLWIRVLYRRAHTLPEEIALGVTLGYALEILTYIPARALGQPLLVAAWPIGTYAVFFAVPQLRRRWKGASRAGRTPLWWSWCTALAVIYLIGWIAVNFYRTQALTWPAIGRSYVDMPFHLALIGELKHHMPPTMPGVAGEPLGYHWFVHAHMAAASWITGVEPRVLLYRLAVLPMLAALVVLLGLVGRRVTGSRMGALAAVASTILITAPSFYLGTATGVFSWRAIQSWVSPSQTFGALLFAPIVVLLIDLLGRRRQPRGWWVVLGIMLVAVMGAKATFLPLLAAGLVMVVLVEAARSFCLPRRALAALGLTATCLLFAEFGLFGGARQGLVVDPLSIIRVTLRDLTGAGDAAEVSTASVLGVTLLCVLSGVITWCGALGLLSRPRLLAQPVVVLVLSMSAAGLGAALLLGHPHLSQGYFLQASYPYLAMIAVYGIGCIARRAGVTLRAMVFAAGIGVTAVYVIRMLCAVKVPLEAGEDETVLYLPYLALLGVVLLGVLVMRAARQSKLRICALVICMVTAAGTPAAWFANVMPDLYGSQAASVRDPYGTAPAPAIPKGAFAAGNWLRAHSDPDDLIATNTHCRWGYESPCDSREFWATALSERRVLVEGWAYTATNMDSRSPGKVKENLPFWDRERIRANDAVFQAPSSDAVRYLRDHYGVRWLFVDERRMSAGVDLSAFAQLRFRSEDHAVYQLSNMT
ncbi:hypothetical protein [Nonomuraea aurantiaca]|uniref:hypothetical protein n=1 Tax=Nonomuraea aurantiaca TaxID=2878562 RepID=UPI001CDA46D0|nr:hypothetical protein [Nonomuraea aurantiaca]MCA2229189.1 hypothetical protein [Nonomuraea aurantiaca]